MSGLRALGDPALGLAVIEALADLRRLDLCVVPPPKAKTRINAETLKTLLGLPVRTDDLQCIEELWWEGGGHRVQHLVWPLWHGEDDTFFVHSLAGISVLSSLKKLTLATDADLAPLLDLAALSGVRLLLSGGSQERSASALALLEARGVKVMVENYDATPKAARALSWPKGAAGMSKKRV